MKSEEVRRPSNTCAGQAEATYLLSRTRCTVAIVNNPFPRWMRTSPSLQFCVVRNRNRGSVLWWNATFSRLRFRCPKERATFLEYNTSQEFEEAYRHPGQLRMPQGPVASCINANPSLARSSVQSLLSKNSAAMSPKSYPRHDQISCQGRAQKDWV